MVLKFLSTLKKEKNVLPKKIMIVEDEMLTVRYLQGIVEKLGISVCASFDNGEDVLELLKTMPCDMILMDINIKGNLDGLETTRIILQRYQIPVIFITAYNDQETLNRALDLAPYGFIAKPFTQYDIEVGIRFGFKRFMVEHRADTYQKEEHAIQLSKSFWFDVDTGILMRYNYPMKLNAKENLLLKLFLEHRNQMISTSEIESYVWNDDIVSNTSVRTLVYSLRKIFDGEVNIETLPKQGYILHIL